MIPPQLALLIAKYGKQLLIILVFLLILFSCKMALNYHERVVAQNAELQSQVASVELARKVDAEKAQAQKNAIQKWRDAHDELQRKLAEQLAAQTEARKEKDKINDWFRDNDLAKLAVEDRSNLEIRVNFDTSRLYRLLVCASAGRVCDDGGSGPAPVEDGAAPSLHSGASGPPLDGVRAGVLPGS